MCESITTAMPPAHPHPVARPSSVARRTLIRVKECTPVATAGPREQSMKVLSVQVLVPLRATGQLPRSTRTRSAYREPEESMATQPEQS